MQIVDLMRECFVEEVWHEVCCLQARSCHSAMTLEKCVLVFVCVCVHVISCCIHAHLIVCSSLFVCHCAAMWGSEPFFCPGPASGHQRPLGQHRWLMSSVGDSIKFCRESLVLCCSLWLCIRVCVCMCVSHCSVYELLSSALHQILSEKRLCYNCSTFFYLFLVYLLPLLYNVMCMFFQCWERFSGLLFI